MKLPRERTATPKQRARAVQTVLQRINPEKEPDLHAHLFEVYLDELKVAMDLKEST